MRKMSVILFFLLFIIFCANAMHHSHPKGKTAEIGVHHLPTILFCADNQYHSHLQLSIEMANILGSSGKYKVHFLVADHSREKDNGSKKYKNLNTENGAITLINVPIDQKYLDEEFLKKVPPSTFSNWAQEVKTLEKPDFWARLKTYTMALYQAISTNPKVLVDGVEHKALDWLRERQHSEHPYILGIAEYGVSASAFALFEELGIHNFVATSATPLLPAFYYFIGMSIPLKMPEFFSAAPKEKYNEMGENWVEKNKEQYEISINKIKKVFYEENISIYEKIRENAEKKGILLKKTSPLGDMLRRCQAVLINQPSSSVNFDLPNAPEMLKYIGGIGTKYLELFSKKFADKKSRKHEKDHKDPLAEEAEKKQWKKEEKCVVILSLGTLVNFQGMSEQAVKNMFKAFENEPDCQFLIRFDKKLITSLELEPPSNVKIVDFREELLPQQEILAQNNVRAFISHCGQNSLNEAVFAGVPLICIPFFYDQPFNTALIEHLGIGIWVKHDEFEQKFPTALEQILHDSKYSEKMKKLAIELHAKKHPQNVFLDAIAEAIKASSHHKGEHAKSADFGNVATVLGPINFI